MLVIINNMSFDHQDWDNVVFTKKQSTTLTTKDIRNSNYNTKHRVIGNANRTTSGQKLHKIHNETESFEVKKISLSLSLQIQQARLQNRITQKDLANKINVSYKIINDYESGKAIPDNNIKMKIQKALGVIFKR